jgi:hypothetical protein
VDLRWFDQRREQNFTEVGDRIAVDVRLQGIVASLFFDQHKSLVRFVSSEELNARFLSIDSGYLPMQHR